MVGDSLVFASRAEADRDVRNLMSRWKPVTDTRVDETSDP
jgi:hypothetical protein